MKLILKFFCLLLFVFTFHFSFSQEKPSDLVNPLIGTAPLTDPAIIGYTPPQDWRVWAGLTFPGSALPNAMVQLSPITKWGSGAGYEYEDTAILGFAHTNKGHWNLCNLPVLPISTDATAPFQSSFSHAKENASPGYYDVYLEGYKVAVKLTSTLRTGIHEYKFDNPKGRRILFGLGKANNDVSDWEIEMVDGKSVSGFQRVGRDKVHFYATLNHEVSELTLEKKGEKDGYAILLLSDDNAGAVIMKIGLSYVSITNAKENLERESIDATFEEVQMAAVLEWNTLLSKISVKSNSHRDKEMFYTSLYRTFLWPALRSDVNGEFTDETGNTQRQDFKYYTIPSLWDTYRNKLVLLSILSPEVTGDVISSLISRAENTGFVPTFFHGDHGAPFIAGSYKRGIRNFDVRKAYTYLLNNAYNSEGPRALVDEYIEKGFISDPDVANPHVETKAQAGVSKTLEYAYDDYSLAILADTLDDQENYEDLMRRSQNYKNVFDPSVNFMRGRLANGDWITPFDPEYPYYEYMYREANAWQVSFYAPHDMPGLVKLYGGDDKFEAKLDEFFTKPWNPNHIARNISTFIGQYCQGNQPDHEAPFAYYYVGKPEKSQVILDKIMTELYGIGPEGLALSGMDDAGEMSSWFVAAAVGLYPMSPADADYLVTVPLFDEVTWKVDNGNDLVIVNPNRGRNLQEIKVNGEAINGYYVDHDLFRRGGKIEVVTD
ncbi:GH92 family glycosyl hydrolase [Algoriphagus sp. D3-2-R+10]|uniref:GH92 family glycosyl hydrolase n=1 Tax=Algoriphagus aurantiacus TaxID=3103948 RepID=UPI002B384D87|nr:GH92 family glycosyl hydrolase [Algoriphagus sp. D3-2-R+10]MEB2776446.1 GH92 family glycosyl hydrolase [Algoriphagus sp. D3-2-R+10]